MQTEPRITVVIPAYNYARYLGDCIESVLNQSEPAHEIIVVDDESTDDPAQVIANFYPYKIKYIRQKNKGLAGARNTGIKEATGEYILCLDADDMLRSDSIKEYKKLADKNSIAQLGMLYFGTQVATFRPTGATLESLLRSNSVYCNSVFPKSAWEKIGGYDESDTMRLGLEDWLAWIEMCANGYKVKTGDYVSLLYRRHENAMTQTTTHPHWDIIISYMKKKVKDKYGLESNFHSIKPTISE